MDPLATKRVHVLVRVAFLWAALIVARLIQLQVVQHPQFAELAREDVIFLQDVGADFENACHASISSEVNSSSVPARISCAGVTHCGQTMD